MAIDIELTELMLDYVTIYPYTSVDSYGKRTRGTGVRFKCRVVRKNVLHQDNESREDVVVGKILTADNASTLSINDLIEFADGSFGSIMSVSTVTDDLGEYHHATIEFGR